MTRTPDKNGVNRVAYIAESVRQVHRYIMGIEASRL